MEEIQTKRKSRVGHNPTTPEEHMGTKSNANSKPKETPPTTTANT